MYKEKLVFQDMMVGARSIFQQETTLFQKDLRDVIGRSYAYLLQFPDIWMETPRPVSQEELVAEAEHLKEMRLLQWNALMDANQSDEDCWETLRSITDLYTRIGSGTCLVLPTYAVMSAELINVISRNLARPGVQGGVARMARLQLAVNSMSYAGAQAEHILVTETRQAVRDDNLRTMAATLALETEASSAEIIELVEDVVFLTEKTDSEDLSEKQSAGKILAETAHRNGTRATSIVRQLCETLERTVHGAIRYVDRRRYPRFNVFISGTLRSADYSMFESVVVKNLSIGGVMMNVDASAIIWHTGNDCVVDAPGLGGVHKGKIVAARDGIVQVAFANDDMLTIEQLEDAVFAGALALMENIKASHEEFISSVRSSLTDKTKKVAEVLFNHHTCDLGRWYDAIGDEEIRRSKSYKAIREPHVKIHVCARRAISLFQQDDLKGMNEALDDMDAASREVSALLGALRVKMEQLYEQRRQRET